MDSSRRSFLKKAGLYAAPLILTVAVRPAFASTGYNCQPRDCKPQCQPKDCQPKCNSFTNFFRGR